MRRGRPAEPASRVKPATSKASSGSGRVAQAVWMRRAWIERTKDYEVEEGQAGGVFPSSNENICT